MERVTFTFSALTSHRFQDGGAPSPSTHWEAEFTSARTSSEQALGEESCLQKSLQLRFLCCYFWKYFHRLRKSDLLTTGKGLGPFRENSTGRNHGWDTCRQLSWKNNGPILPLTSCATRNNLLKIARSLAPPLPTVNGDNSSISQRHCCEAYMG